MIWNFWPMILQSWWESTNFGILPSFQIVLFFKFQCFFCKIYLDSIDSRIPKNLPRDTISRFYSNIILFKFCSIFSYYLDSAIFLTSSAHRLAWANKIMNCIWTRSWRLSQSNSISSYITFLCWCEQFSGIWHSPLSKEILFRVEKFFSYYSEIASVLLTSRSHNI